MNPFLEPTVAAPQPLDEWRKPSTACPGAPKQVARLGRRRAAGGRPGKAEPAPRKQPGRFARMWQAAALAAALLVPGLAVAVDINTATPQQLQEIKGIGPKTADIIIQERERGGGFESFNDVSERVKGIGPKKAAALQAAGLTVGSAAAVADKAAETGGRSAAAAARRGR